jgi:hypothetical protein
MQGCVSHHPICALDPMLFKAPGSNVSANLSEDGLASCQQTSHHFDNGLRPRAMHKLAVAPEPSLQQPGCVHAAPLVELDASHRRLA